MMDETIRTDDIRDLFSSRGGYNRNRARNITTLTHGLPTRECKLRRDIISPNNMAAKSRRDSSIFS